MSNVTPKTMTAMIRKSDRGYNQLEVEKKNETHSKINTFDCISIWLSFEKQYQSKPNNRTQYHAKKMIAEALLR
jgi:hypothetical protein